MAESGPIYRHAFGGTHTQLLTAGADEFFFFLLWLFETDKNDRVVAPAADSHLEIVRTPRIPIRRVRPINIDADINNLHHFFIYFNAIFFYSFTGSRTFCLLFIFFLGVNPQQDKNQNQNPRKKEKNRCKIKSKRENLSTTTELSEPNFLFFRGTKNPFKIYEYRKAIN